MRWEWPAGRVEQRDGEWKITGRAAEEWIVTEDVTGMCRNTVSCPAAAMVSAANVKAASVVAAHPEVGAATGNAAINCRSHKMR